MELELWVDYSFVITSIYTLYCIPVQQLRIAKHFFFSASKTTMFLLILRTEEICCIWQLRMGGVRQHKFFSSKK